MQAHFKSFLFRLGLRWILFAVCGGTPFWVLAHGDLHERIEALGRSIQSQPGNSDLFLQRGEIERLHGEPRLAIPDFKRALELNPALDLAELGLGRSWLDAGSPAQAKPILDAFLTKHPKNAEALLVRARVLGKLGQRRAAAADYTGALGAASTPLPDIYLERAGVLAEEGLIDEAIAGLDEGTHSPGKAAALELRAIELELGRKRYDAALARLDLQIRSAPRKEFLLCRRGAILEEAGRSEEAHKSYVEAARALQSSPPERQATKATQELILKIRMALERLKPAAEKNLNTGS